jgi:hypothetical protein
MKRVIFYGRQLELSERDYEKFAHMGMELARVFAQIFSAESGLPDPLGEVAEARPEVLQ